MRVGFQILRGAAVFWSHHRALLRRHRRDEAGFSIIEVAIGATLVAIVGVATALMFGTGQALVQNQGDTRIALYLAGQRLEQVRATGYGSTSLPDTREETSWVDMSTLTPSYPGYQRTTTFAGVCPTNFTLAWNDGGCSPATTVVEAKLITVTVRVGSMPTGDPQAPDVVLQTVIIRR